jgi:hypothetical protein
MSSNSLDVSALLSIHVKFCALSNRDAIDDLASMALSPVRKLSRYPYTGRPECIFLHTDSRTATGKLPIDDDRGYGSYAMFFRLRSNCGVVHIEHLYVAGRASDALD